MEQANQDGLAHLKEQSDAGLSSRDKRDKQPSQCKTSQQSAPQLTKEVVIKNQFNNVIEFEVSPDSELNQQQLLLLIQQSMSNNQNTQFNLRGSPGVNNNSVSFAVRSQDPEHRQVSVQD